MAKIKGVWVFNDVVSHFYWLASYQMINVTFTSNGERFTSLYWYDVPAGDDTIYHLSYDETLAVAGPFGNLYNWDNDAYKTVDFGSAEQEVSAEFLAWMQENATLQEEEKPTADSVKSHLQSLLTASNAKTGKSDTNLTDAVNTLIEGYGKGGGGGGECSGNHIIEVDTLPEVGEEGKIYAVKTFSDVFAIVEGQTFFYSQVLEGVSLAFVTATSTTKSNIANVDFAFYYLTDIPDICFAEYGFADYAKSLGETDLQGLPFNGEITDIANATEEGYYAYFGGERELYQYINGEYRLLVKKGGLEYTSNGDGTCYVSGLGKYHDEQIAIPSISPSGDTVTAIGERAFSARIGLSNVNIPNSVTIISDYAFGWCRGLDSITIPNSVTSLGYCAFGSCTSLTSITFAGTMEQWNAINKNANWHLKTPATKVVCTDGTVTL